MKFFCYYLLILNFCLLFTTAHAQDIPPVYSQFYMNPFVYNPAYAGSDGYTSLYMVHRRQWIGIEDAPVTSSISLHTPLSKKIGAGLLLSHDKAGIIRSTHLSGTFAYIIPIGEHHHFRMGLSTGLSQQNLDLTSATPEQLAYLANRAENANHFHAKFGINYRFRNLNIGIASNNLSRAPSYNGQYAGKKMSAPLHDLVLNAIYYLTIVPERVQAEPYLILHRFEQNQRMEGGLLFYFKNTLWSGASYRNDYGITTHFGINVKEMVKFAYAFELGNKAVSGIARSTHEVQVAIKLGKEKNYSKEIIRKPRFEM